MARTSPAIRHALRLVAVAYLALMLIVPVGLVFWRTFANGPGPVWEALRQPNAVHAFKITLEVALLSVVCNTVFGVAAAVLVVRHDVPGKRLLTAFIDLPVAVSPVVAGLALILVLWIQLDRIRRKYAVTNRRVSCEYGIINKNSNEVRVQDGLLALGRGALRSIPIEFIDKTGTGRMPLPILRGI